MLPMLLLPMLLLLPRRRRGLEVVALECGPAARRAQLGDCVLNGVVTLKGGNRDRRAVVLGGGQPMGQRWLVAVNHAHTSAAEASRSNWATAGAEGLFDASHRFDAAVFVSFADGLLHRAIEPTRARQPEDLLEACI